MAIVYQLIASTPEDLTDTDGPTLRSLLMQDLASRSPSALEAFMTDHGVAAVLEASASA